MLRQLLAASIGLFLALALTACQAPAPATAPAPAGKAEPAAAPPAKPVAGPGSVPADQKEVLLAGFGGSFEKTMREHVIPPFERKYGVKVVYVTGTSTANFAKLQAAKAAPSFDILWGNDFTHLTGKLGGLYVPLDPKRLTNLPNVYDIAKDKDGIGVQQGFQMLGLEYNTKVFKERGVAPPTSWLDLWRPEFRRRVAIYTMPHGYGNYFLPIIASLSGGSIDNVEPGFAKIKELAPHVITFVDPPAKLDDLLKQGEAWITYNGSARVYELAKAGFPVEFARPKEGGYAFVNWFDVVKGAPHPELAQELVNHLIGDEAQAAMAKEMFWGPVVRTVPKDSLPADLLAKIVFGPEDIAKLKVIDFAKINQNADKWAERWRKEIESK